MSLKQKLVKEAMDLYEGKSFDSNAQDLSATLSGSSEGHITAATKPKKEPPKSVTPKDPKPKTPPPKKNDPVSPRGDGAPTVSSGNTREAHNRDFAAQITTGRAAAEGKSGKGPDNKTPYGFVDRASSTIKGAKARRVSSGNTVKDHESDAASQIASGRANQEGKGGRSNSFTELSHPVKARTLSDKGKPSIMDKVGRGLASALISRIPIIGDDIAKQMKKDFAKTDAKLASDKKELDKIKGEGNAAFNASRAAGQGKGGGSNNFATPPKPTKSYTDAMEIVTKNIEKDTGVKRGTGPLKREGGKKAPAIPKIKSFEEMVGGGVKGAINSLTPKPPPFKAGDGVRKNPVKPVVPKTPTKKPVDKGLEPKTTPKKPTTPSFLLKPTVTPAPAKSAMGFTIPKVTPAPAATPAPVKPTTPKKEAPKGTTPPRFTSPATPKTTPKKEAPKKEAPKPTDKQKENKSRLDKMKADKKTTPKKEVPKTTPKPAPKPAPKPTAKQLSNKARLDKMKADKKTTPKKEAPKPKPKPTAKQVSNKDRLNKMKANKKTTPKKTTPKKQSLGGKIKNFFRRKK